MGVVSAFGNPTWADTPRATLEPTKWFASSLATQWGPGAIHLHSQQPDGAWKLLLVAGNRFQGRWAPLLGPLTKTTKIIMFTSMITSLIMRCS